MPSNAVANLGKHSNPFTSFSYDEFNVIVPTETFIKHHTKILEMRHMLDRSAIYTNCKRIYIRQAVKCQIP